MTRTYFAAAVAAAVIVLASTPGFAAPCTVDPRRANFGPKSSVGDALICDGTNLRGMWATIDRGEIIGLSWRQHVGQKERSIQVHRTGELFFLVLDEAVQGTFSAKTRAVSRHVFPRNKRIRVESNGQGRYTVHDSAGNAWTLVATPWKQWDQSFEITAINGKKQKLRPMDFTPAGIVGLDIAAFGPLVLIKNEPSSENFANRRTEKYHRTKSVFVDRQGTRCEVENRKLFGPAPTDPTDKFENALVFPDDKSLRSFLQQTCSKLDLSVF